MAARKKISRKKSIRRTELFQKAADKLNAGEYEGIKRTVVRDVTAAVVEVLLENSVADRGIALPGLGKLNWKCRPAREAGERMSFGQMVQVKARPESWIPRFRLQKSARVALLEAAGK